MLMALALLLPSADELIRSVYQHSQDKWVFEEKFAGKPGKGWSWIREEAGSWKVEKNALHLKALPGTLWEGANSAKNILVRALPAPDDGSVAVEAVVAGAPAVEGEEAGILLYQDDDTYVKLVRTFLEGKPHLLFAREAKGVAVTLQSRQEAAASHRLRLRLEDRRVQAEFLAAGASKWVVAGYAESPFPPEGLKAGLYAQGAPAAAPRWATFTDFRMGSPASVGR